MNGKWSVDVYLKQFAIQSDNFALRDLCFVVTETSKGGY